MSDGVKLPVFGTVGRTARESWFVIRRLWPLVLACTLILFALTEALGVPRLTYTGSPMQKHDPWVLFFYRARPILFILTLIFLAIVTHIEVLRGAVMFRMEALLRAPSRAIGYVFDLFFAMLSFLIFYPLYIFFSIGIGYIFHLRLGQQILQLACVIYILLFYPLALAIVSRLALRLPSRAVGRPLAWVDAWRMSRGNVLRLMASHFLVSGLLIWPLAVVLLPPLLLTFVAVGPAGHSPSSPVPGLLISLGNSLLLTVDAIGYSAFFSVVFARLGEGQNVEECDAPSAA